MIFKTLEEKCNYYRSLTDYKLLPNGYIVVMLDGRSFSKKIKNKFVKPFDEHFVSIMNKTAQYLCENISGCILAYTQSDEISLLIKDTNLTEPFFGNRLCKMQSIITSMATSKFMQLMTLYTLEFKPSINIEETILNMNLYEFDCKVWNVPNSNEAFAWILWRQNDCIRNSKQQFCQTYASHKELVKKNTDEQVIFVKEKYEKDWNKIGDDLKFGRLICKEKQELYDNERGISYERNHWICQSMVELNNINNRMDFLKII